MNKSIIALFAIVSLILPCKLSAQTEVTVYDGTSGIVVTSVQNDTARIMSIVPKSPADKAGLQYQDQIITINGLRFSGKNATNTQLKELLTGNAEDSLTLLIKREAQDSLFSVTLKNDLYLHELEYYQFKYLVDSLEEWDISDVLSDSMQGLFLDPTLSKCLVYSIEPGSVAEQEGIKPGDLILSLSEEMRLWENEIGMGSLDRVTRDTSITLLRDSTEIHLNLDPSKKGALEGIKSQYSQDYSNKCIWLKINTYNNLASNRSYLFSFQEMEGDGLVNFYELSPGQSFIEKQAGVSIPVESRDYNYKDWCAVQAFLVKGSSQTFYVKLSSIKSISSPLVTVIAQETIGGQERTERMILSAFYGMMLIIALYYLVLYFTGRQSRFIYFSLYILSFALLLFTLEGFFGEFTWSQASKYQTFTSAFDVSLYSLVSIFFLLFGRAYLELKRYLKGWNITVMVLIGLCILTITLNIITIVFNDVEFKIIKQLIIWIYLVVVLLLPMFILMVPAILRIREGSGPAWFFLVSNIILAVSIFTSFNSTSIKYTAYTMYRPEFATMMQILAVYLSAIIQFLLFSVGLARKMKVDEQEKKVAQERVIVQLRENEKLKDQVTRELEQKVNERTREILEQKEEIEAQRDEIEAQRDQLTDSINYAERIQSAVMPHKDYLDVVMPEYFVLFQPRDIVSGDFYWIKEVKDHLVLVAADCTGHGVPGAFMSMLGIAFLNEQVGKSQVKNPGEILNSLRDKMKETMSQEGRHHEQQDGMDMALAIIDKNTQELFFAGAYNPLYIVRSSKEKEDEKLEPYLSQEGDNFKLFELKGDRQPIAIHAMEAEFETTKIKLQKDDTLYLFSDGFVDQKGGPDKRKFLSKNFKKMLLKIQPGSMVEQKKKLEETMESWRGEFEQIDDILVIGIRV